MMIILMMVLMLMLMLISRRGHRNHELGAELDDSDVQSDQFNSQATQVLIMMIKKMFMMVMMMIS